MTIPSDRLLWQDYLKRRWDIDADLSPLAGEFDLNYLAKSADGHCYIVKVMRADCSRWLVNTQISALEHIRDKSTEMPVPRVHYSLTSEGSEVVQDHSGKERFMWVIEYLPGKCYAKAAPKTPQLAN